MTRRWNLVCVAGLALLPGAVMAQEHQTGGNEGTRPIGWQVRTDAGGHKMAGDVDTIAFAQIRCMVCAGGSWFARRARGSGRDAENSAGVRSEAASALAE